MLSLSPDPYASGSATIAADILTPGMPSTRTGTGYYIFENYDTGKENLDLIIKKLLDLCQK